MFQQCSPPPSYTIHTESTHLSLVGQEAFPQAAGGCSGGPANWNRCFLQPEPSCEELQKKGYLPRLDEDLRGLTWTEYIRIYQNISECSQNAEKLKEAERTWNRKHDPTFFQGWIYDLFKKGQEHVTRVDRFPAVILIALDAQLLPDVSTRYLQEKWRKSFQTWRTQSVTQRDPDGDLRACWISPQHRKDLEEVEKKLENVLSPKVALN